MTEKKHRKIYFAPLEGITAYPYRNAHSALYRGVDKYYMPFVTAVNSGKMRGKELRDIRVENNDIKRMIPQILTKSAVDFAEYAKRLQDMGYEEINLNAGCPSGTVTAKGKGAGLLADLDTYEEFLDGIFRELDGCVRSGLRISVKTRIGVDLPLPGENSCETAEQLVRIYNQYPIAELIVHPRYQRQFYKGKPDQESFSVFYEKAQMPLVYNGDIGTIEDYAITCERYPDLHGVMIGRGLLRNPELAEWIKETEEKQIASGPAHTNRDEWSSGIQNGQEQPKKVDVERLKHLHDCVYRNWMDSLHNPGNVLFRMKELWEYLAVNFPDSKKGLKKIKKAKNEQEYLQAVAEMFR